MHGGTLNSGNDDDNGKVSPGGFFRLSHKRRTACIVSWCSSHDDDDEELPSCKTWREVVVIIL